MAEKNGFTLIELVMVLVLIGIIAAVAAPRLFSVTTTNAGAVADRVRADLRYAQNLAMTKNMRHRVYFNAAPAPNPGYTIVNDADGDGTWGEAGEIALDPSGGGELSMDLSTGPASGITVSAPPGGYFEFDALGRPTAGGGATIVISPGGYSVTVTTETGAVLRG